MHGQLSTVFLVSKINIDRLLLQLSKVCVSQDFSVIQLFCSNKLLKASNGRN